MYYVLIKVVKVLLDIVILEVDDLDVMESLDVTK